MLATWGCTTFSKPTLDLQFVGATSLDNRITFSRGSQATLFDSAGTLVYAANNTIRNNTMVGAVAGTPGTDPTNWTNSVPVGITQQLVGTGTENGITYIDYRFSGTATGAIVIRPDSEAQVIASSGQAWTGTSYAKLISGSLTNVGCRLNMRQGLAAGTLVSQTNVVFTPTTAALNTQRFINSVASMDPTTERIMVRVVLDTTGAIDITLRIGMPQLEIGPAATAVNATSGTAYYGPRFDYTPSTLAAQGLLIEEQRTNSIRNNTMQGAAAGTPGTAPTNWAISGLGTLTQTVVGTGTANGINYIDVRFSGTTSTTQLVIRFDSTGAIAAANGQSWAISAWLAVVGGSTANTNNYTLANNLFDSGNVYIGEGPSITLASPPTSTFTRYSGAGTISNASTASIRPYFYFLFASGVAIDITLRIGLPQLEQGAFATSVIPTTTTALTRNADVASMTGTNFSGWFNATEGTVVAIGQMLSVSSAASRSIFDATDGSTNNRTSGRLLVSGGGDQATIRSGASTQFQTSSANSTTTAVKNLAIAYKASDFAITSNGSAPATQASGSVPTGVNQMQIGSAVGGSEFLCGYIRRIAYYPVRLPNSTLQALTA